MIDSVHIRLFNEIKAALKGVSNELQSTNSNLEILIDKITTGFSGLNSTVENSTAEITKELQDVNTNLQELKNMKMELGTTNLYLSNIHSTQTGIKDTLSDLRADFNNKN